MSTISVNAGSLFLPLTRMDEEEMNKIWPRRIVCLPSGSAYPRQDSLMLWMRRAARTGWSNCCQEVVINRLIGDLSHIFRLAYNLPSLFLIDDD